MAIHPIIHLPDVRLRASNSAVTLFDDALQQLIEDMFETMYVAKGIGLAAPQIAINKQLAVIDVSKDQSAALCLINPKIIERRGEVMLEEGCLSIPGVYDKAPRASWIKFHALDRYGVAYQMEVDGLLAHCVQHELDHLQGKLFVDYLSSLKRQLALKKLKKLKKRQDKF